MPADASLLAALRPHISSPATLQYRERIDGRLDSAALANYTTLLVDIRAISKKVTQKIMADTLAALALEQEGVWHLGDERSSWAEAHARRLRALMHDVSNNLTKYPHNKMPGWLLPFAANNVADSPPTSPSPTPPPAALPAKPASEPATATTEIFAWDDELLAAYKHIPGKARDYCKRIIAAGNDEDDVVAVWADGTKWEAPVATVGEWNKSKTKAILQIYDWHEVKGVGKILVKQCLAKEKEWVILWVEPGPKVKTQL